MCWCTSGQEPANSTCHYVEPPIRNLGQQNKKEGKYKLCEIDRIRCPRYRNTMKSRYITTLLMVMLFYLFFQNEVIWKHAEHFLSHVYTWKLLFLQGEKNGRAPPPPAISLSNCCFRCGCSRVFTNGTPLTRGATPPYSTQEQVSAWNVYVFWVHTANLRWHVGLKGPFTYTKILKDDNGNSAAVPSAATTYEIFRVPKPAAGRHLGLSLGT